MKTLNKLKFDLISNYENIFYVVKKAERTF